MKQDINTLWKKLANEKKNTTYNHIEYCILRAMQSKGEDKVAIAKHFLRKAFPPVTSTIKLANGRNPFDTLEKYLYLHIYWKSFNTTILEIPTHELLDEEELKQYIEITKILNEGGRQNLVRRYSYFFTRQDIFDEYQLVQTAHVALELGNRLSQEQVKDLHFTCCGVTDLQELEALERVLETMKLNYVVFREPDIGNQKTSIGVYPVYENHKGLLRNYNLLRFKSGVTPVRECEEEVR